MDVSDLRAVFVLPLAKDTPVDVTLLGVVSTLASSATSPVGILLAGYVIRLVRASNHEMAMLSSLDSLVGMAIDGARLSAILVALQLPVVGLVTVSLPGSRPSIAILSYAANPVMLGSFGITTPDTAGLIATGLASLLGSYLSLVATVALAREASLAVVILATRDLASDRSFIRIASTVALVVLVTRPFVTLCVAIPIVGALLIMTASSLPLVVSVTPLGRGALDASLPGTDATRESHVDGANAEPVKSMELVLPAWK